MARGESIATRVEIKLSCIKFVDMFVRRNERMVNEDILRRGSRGATVARLTPDQKVACSNHVEVIRILSFFADSFLPRFRPGGECVD